MVPFEFTDRSRDSRNTRIISGLFISFFLSPQSSIFFPSFFRRNENTERKEKRRGNFNRFKEFTISVRKLTSPTSSSRDLQLHRNRINSIPIEIRLSRISQIHFHFVQGFASPSPSVITPPTIAETRTVYQRERIEIRVMQRAMRAQLAAASFASRQDPFVLVSDSFSCVASVSIDRADDTRRNAVYCSFSRGSHCSLRDRNTSRSGLKFNLLLGFVRFEGRCIFVSFFYFSNVFIPTHCHKGRSYL